MSIVVNSNAYKGQYGTSSEVGDIIHVEIIVDDDVVWPIHKEVIFLIDISSSMYSVLKSVKSSLLAFRDAILNKSHRQMESIGQNQKDQMVRNRLDIRLIVFSNTAKEIWSPESIDRFEDTVLGIDTEAMTNMGDGIKLAFEKTNSSKYTWIVIMTDGNSNCGPYKTANSFQKYVSSHQPPNTKIITLGYGNHFDPETLNQIGSFVYINDDEMISVVLGNVAAEIMDSIGFNCTIDIPEIQLESIELNDDTIIVPEGEAIGDQKGKIIVGDRLVGPLCINKEYNYVFLPHGNNISDSMMEKYNQIMIRYKYIYTDNMINIQQTVIKKEEPPSEKIRELYFQSESKRLIHRLYHVIQKGDLKDLQTEIQTITRSIKKWNESISELYREDILKIIESTYKDDFKGMELESFTLNYAINSGYDKLNKNGYSDIAQNASKYYLDSPFFEF